LIASASIISVVEAGSRCRSIIRRKSLFEKAERLVLWNVSKGEILTDECWQLVFSNIPGSVSRARLYSPHLPESLTDKSIIARVERHTFVELSDPTEQGSHTRDGDSCYSVEKKLHDKNYGSYYSPIGRVWSEIWVFDG
jgi:hypothetical protein